MDVETLETQESTTPTMEDTIRAGLAELEENGIVELDKPVLSNRDEKGRFTTKQEEQEEKIEQVEEQKEDAPVVARKAPSSLRKEVQEKWATLDPLLQDEFEKREADFHKGIESYKTKAQEAEEWNRAIAPFMPTIQQFGVTPQTAVQELFKADQILRYGTPTQKVQMFNKLLNDYQVDKTWLGAEQTDALTPLYQTVQTLEQRLMERERKEAELQQLQYQREISSLNSEVNEFSKDKEHFEVVKEDMARLLEAGAAPDLATLYETACWANPQVRQLMIAKQRETEKAEASRQVQEAKKANIVNTKKTGKIASTGKATSSMDETIRAEMERLGIN